jgi:hypothetical protein
VEKRIQTLEQENESLRKQLAALHASTKEQTA